jgi:signal transduction histidine kinase
MQRLSTKLIILLILAALVPLCLYGILSIWTARKAQYQSVSQGNLRVALRAAEQIQLYIGNSLSVLKAIAENINRIGLEHWQQEAIIKNYVLNFPEFEEIYITDRRGEQIISTRLNGRLGNISQEPVYQEAISGKVYRSEVTVSPDFIPIMTIAVPLRRFNRIDGIVAAQVSLMDMWNLVDSIKIGQRGYALVVSQTGKLIAHGRNEAKPLILQQENLMHLNIVQAGLVGKPTTMVYQGRMGEEVLGVAAPIPSLHWVLLIEQPTAEAFYTIHRMTYQLLSLIVVCLVIMILLGYWGGKTQIVRPIQDLIAMTRRIAQGDLNQRVTITTAHEFAHLGQAFNQMSEQLIELQEEIRRNERTVTFGRIAAGLVHDLRHPIKNIENSSQLMLRFYEDESYRNTFQRTIQREFSSINRFLSDLHNLTHSTPLQPIALDINKVVEEIVESFREIATQAQVRIITRLQAEDGLRIRADRFALERLFRNLVLNAIQAMPNGGELVISTRSQGDQVEIQIKDTGCGIPQDQLKNIFTDYTTTKKKGLGLGLAITKKIVEEHQGTIVVTSEPGKGTCFKLYFARLISSESLT